MLLPRALPQPARGAYTAFFPVDLPPVLLVGPVQTDPTDANCQATEET
jgi:hypothetical protein